MSDDVLQLRLTGEATSLHTALDRARKDAAKTAKDMLSSATKAEREAAALKQKGAAVTAAVMTATERYRRELSSLNKLLNQSAITQQTYNRAVDRIRQSLPSVQKTQEQHNRALAQAKQITEAMMTPAEHHNRLVLQLNNLLRNGHITRTTYNRAIEESKKHLPAVIEAEKNAAAAQKLLDDQMARGKQLMDSILPPAIRYQRLHTELGQLLRLGAIDQRSYLQLLAQESQKLPEVAKAQQMYDQAKQQGKYLTQQLLRPSEQYQQRLRELNYLLRDGHINNQTYLRALRQLALEFNNISPAIQRAAGSLRQLGGSLRMGGYLASASITAPLTAFATAGIHTLMEFDRAMTNSLSIAENVTPKLRKQMEDVAITLSEKTAHSATELAEAYYELISAGLSAEASMQSLNTVSKFAIAGTMNLESSVKQLAKATAAMGLSGKTAEETARGMARTANVLVQAANMTTGSIEDMTQALVNAAAPQARLLNMSLEDTVAVLMHYIQVGESAAASSEHFAIGMRLLGQAQSQHKDFWKQQGLDLYTASGQMRKFTDVLRDMQKIYLKLTPQARVPFLKSLGFEALQQRALNPLLADPEAAHQIDEWAKKLQNMNALDEVAAKQMESLSNQFKVFRNMLQNVGMEIGAMILPYLNKFIYGVKQLIEYWKNLSDGGKTAVVVIGMIAAAIGPALIVLGTLATVAATVAGSIAGIVTAILTIGAPIAAAVAAVGLLVGGFLLLIAGVASYEYALAKWPDETQKTMRVLERMWHAFEGFMGGLFDKIFTVDMLKAVLKASSPLLQTTLHLGELIRKSFTEEVQEQDIEAAVERNKRLIEDAFDRLGGSTDLGGTLARIISEELGKGTESSLDDIKKKIEEALDVEDLRKKMEEMGKGLQNSIEMPTGAFSALSDKMHDVSERFKEQIALEEEQARRGYKKVEQMTSAERELMKLELDWAKERQDLIDRFIKEGLDPENEAVKSAIESLEGQTRAERELIRTQAERLTQLEKQKRDFEELESLSKRYESPMQKFSREAKELKKVFDAGRITTNQFAKDMRKLRDEMMKEIKIDFQVHGVEGVEAGTAEASAALEHFLATQEAYKRPIDFATGKFRDVAAADSASVAKSGKSATVRIPLSREQRRTTELAKRQVRSAVRSVERKYFGNKDPFGRLNRTPAELNPNLEATSRGESNGNETNDLSILREPLERIARATEKTAREKSVKIQPANL